MVSTLKPARRSAAKTPAMGCGYAPPTGSASKYDRPTTPHRRAAAHLTVTEQDKTIMTDTLADVNPAAVQRQIQALTSELLTLTTSKAAARSKPQI